MTYSANEIIGSLVYRTGIALNNDQSFLEELKAYKFEPVIVDNGKLHLWHFPGTQSEIAGVFQELSKVSPLGQKLKFPAILNFQDIVQERGRIPGIITIRYNLAIVSLVNNDWTTQQRDEKVFKLVLRKIYDAFMEQIKKSRYFLVPIEGVPHSYIEVYTTGESLKGTGNRLGESLPNIIKMQYGDYMDAIQLANLALQLKVTECNKLFESISIESKLVTESIQKIK